MRVALLFVYLAIPIDIIPDFIPILGYADDAIIVVLVLRSVCRRVSVEELERLGQAPMTASLPYNGWLSEGQSGVNKRSSIDPGSHE